MDTTDADHGESNLSNLVPFDEWLTSIGKRRVTGWNWRKRGVVKAVNIFGRLYITRAEIARFEARAANGEFAAQRRVAPTDREQDRKSVGFIDRLMGRKSKTAKG
jgi:hypothetical protein